MNAIELQKVQFWCIRYATISKIAQAPRVNRLGYFSNTGLALDRFFGDGEGSIDGFMTRIGDDAIFDGAILAAGFRPFHFANDIL